jgi:hypothetical protein
MDTAFFSKRTAAKDKLDSYCKSCRNGFSKNYSNSNKSKTAARVRNRRQSDINVRLANNLRNRIRDAVTIKKGSAVADLGCSVEALKAHLESQFQPGMNWLNYGNGIGKWNIDHIAPLSKFDLTDRNQFLIACNYKNLQPMWYIENIIKSAKVA